MAFAHIAGIFETMNTSQMEVARKKNRGARIAFMLGVLPAYAALLAGCNRKPVTSPPVSEDPSVVVIAGEPSGNWKAAQRGAMDAGKKLGVRIEWYAPQTQMPGAKPPGNITPEQQQENWIVEATKKKVVGIAVAPINETDLVAAINKAGRTFVPTLVFDAPAYTQETLTFVKNNDREAGVLAAHQVKKIAGDTKRVWVVAAKPDSGGEECAESFLAALRASVPAAQVATLSSGDAVPPGVLFAPDEATSRAALKKVSPATKFIASGSSADLIEGLKNGKVSALIVPDRYAMAFQSVRSLIEYRANRPAQNETEIEIEPVLVTKENLTGEKSRRVLGLEANGSR
jgi:ABC-type sugar transport system substrate-binding protein